MAAKDNRGSSSSVAIASANLIFLKDILQPQRRSALHTDLAKPPPCARALPKRPDPREWCAESRRPRIQVTARRSRSPRHERGLYRNETLSSAVEEAGTYAIRRKLPDTAAESAARPGPVVEDGPESGPALCNPAGALRIRRTRMRRLGTLSYLALAGGDRKS